jgi:membrane protein CcdC involved in cytochrome C biogenesis
MNTPDYVNKLNDIKSRIGQYTQDNKKQSLSTNNILSPKTGFITKLPNIPYNSVLFYIVPVIFTFIILLIWNPKFVTKEVKNENNIVTRKRKFKTILIISIIIGIIIDISIFAYLKKK